MLRSGSQQVVRICQIQLCKAYCSGQNRSVRREVRKQTSTQQSYDQEYEVYGIWDCAVYAKESVTGGHLSGFYYLVSWKGHPVEQNTREPASACIGHPVPSKRIILTSQQQLTVPSNSLHRCHGSVSSPQRLNTSGAD